MFLRKATNAKTGRTYLSIVDGYWDSSAKMSRTKTIQKIGYLDELQKEFDDPVSHFTEIAKQLNAEKQSGTVTLPFDINQELPVGENMRLLGYAPLSKIYHELGLHSFFNNRSRYLQIKYNINNIVKLLVFSRILDPASKKKTYEKKDRFFENTDFSLDDVYRSLGYINRYRDSAQLWIHSHIPYRNTELVYYDVTNYYFEIDEQDELRKKGVSKEHRPDPIVQMGLFMDTNGIPITYRLFPGNINDCETLIPIMRDLKRDYGIGKTIVVADKGMNTHKNIVWNIIKGNGYVYSQTVRGGHKELKDYVLDEEGYRQEGEDFRIKSRVYPREINVTDINGKTKKVRINEKQIILYSNRYSKRAKADREATILKACDLVNNPAKYNRATSYGAAKYVKNLEYDPKTGEILSLNHKPVFNEAKLKEDEKWDGYYAIVTSELDKTDSEIIEIYRGLWKIEESFKLTKSDLEARPVFVTREDHIQAHFLICFIALVILRMLQKRLDNKFSAAYIVESLRKSQCIHMKENHYLLYHRDSVIDAIKDKMGVDLTRKVMRYGDLKNIFGSVKKVFITQ